MTDGMIMLDPTAETSPIERERKRPPASLAGLTIGIIDIGKARGDVFCERLGKRMQERGLIVKRYAKPTNARVAPVELAQRIATECDVVVEALSD